MEKGVLYRKIDKNRKDRNRNQGGYTLVELIVVICIVLILAGGAVFGVMTWIRWSQFKEQNEYAKTLFSAAQNHLTEYSENGQLEMFQKALAVDDGYKNKLDIKGLKDINGDAYDEKKLDILWPSSADKTDKDKYRGEICYLKGNSDTYKQYQDYKAGNGEKPDDEIIALYEMLLPYIYDASILNAAVCVEFTPRDGQVFAVLYSNKNDEFVYNSANKNTRGTVDITNRETSIRKERMVGYYGVDSLSMATTPKAEQPSIKKLKLNNEETLNLSFMVTNKDGNAITNMEYTVVVYDKNTVTDKETQRLKITIDGKKLKKKENLTEPVSCKITRYDTGGKEWNTGEYPMLAWIEDENTVRVVLDAADLSATSYYYNALFSSYESDQKTAPITDNLKDTYSFRRFCVDTENIFCKVKGVGKDYKPTAVRKSNTSHTYFGEYKEADTITYTLKNARHLYNMRYVEDFKPNKAAGKARKSYKYQIAENINWQKFIKEGYLYDTSNIYKDNSRDMDEALVSGVTDIHTPFPSITSLKSNSSLEGKDDKNNTIAGLTLRETANSSTAVYGSEIVKDQEGNDTVQYIKNGPVGLFVQNEGAITNVILDQVAVEGTASVGAFCGENKGELRELTVDNSEAAKRPSAVSGKTDVGGIVGKDAGSKDMQYKNLVNRAAVSGATYVGGIIGRLTVTEGKSGLIEWSKNYGVVEAAPVDDENDQELLSAARYIGGIVGFCNNETGDKTKLSVDHCTSSPQYLDSEIEALFDGTAEGEKALLKKMNGVYVGGIVGYSKDAGIFNCNTIQEKGKEGYIFGNQYVGGIVGFNESQSGNFLDGTDISVSDKKKNTNEANVIGRDYVGGICGINAARGKADGEYGTALPDMERNEEKVVTNWVNKGVVAGYGNYVGGIAGFNTGIIRNCNSEVPADKTAESITDAQSLKGSYVGGIAGYNNGIITSETKASNFVDTTINMVCYITGSDYVGGIVGYNDVDAVIEKYELAGGYIKGKGVYVGGYAGFNASVELLRENTLKSNPNEVTGEYCVSGTIGGNIISTEEPIRTEFTTDNFLGNVYAAAFSGGFIGYNRILPDKGDEGRKFIRELALRTVEYVSDDRNTLWAAAKFMDSNDQSTEGNRSEGSLTIEGIQENQTEQSIRFGNLTADIYVGGVIGYNSPNTSLTIKNVTNKTPITAESAIKNNDEAQEKDQSEFLYSYAGGIIGKAGELVIIDNCRNMDVGDVVTQGTFLGGICEVNAGIIKDCSVSSIGNSKSSYVGGITGFNKMEGTVQNCSFANKTITGEDYVGGIAAQNFGTITNPHLFTGTVNASGSYVGGVAGINKSSGKIIFAKDDTGIAGITTANAKIIGNGTYIGGITGFSEGTIENSFNEKPLNGNDSSLFFTFTGSVLGGNKVGGFAGEVTEGSSHEEMTYLKNAASVTAERGDAGGIAGIASRQINTCTNTGTVTASSKGSAGGIVSVNHSGIKNCYDSGSVLAANGNSGGITGENYGIIEDSDVLSEDDTLIFEGMKNSGGIVGINREGGYIANCSIKGSSKNPVVIANTTDSDVSSIGAVTGENYGQIRLKEDTAVYCNVKSYTSGSSIGGIAGINVGTIKNDSRFGITDDTSEISHVEISLAGSDAVYANMGGVAGINDGSIGVCNVNANIIGDLGTAETGYGGIAGVNNHSISNCGYSGNLLANGSADNIVNLGGIAGINNAGGNISSSYVGILKDTLIKTDKDKKGIGVGYAGGMVGWNYGSVTDSDNHARGSKSVQIINRSGHTGGISGYQMSGAAATGSSDKSILSTGENWSVSSETYSNDFGTGGIIGYSASGKDISHVVNYAKVTAGGSSDNIAVGGLIGRLENKDNDSMTVSSFINYGNITGKLSAGAIGRLKYKGILMSNCVNYGNIVSNGSAAAGIISTLYQTDSGAAIVFDSCKNYGNISANGATAGGIAGNTHGTASGVMVTYTNSLNEGCISGDKAGGILGDGTNQNASFYRCRNYGNKGNDSTKLAGIVQGNYTTMVDCISIGSSKNVARTSSGDIVDSYYLGTGDLNPPPVDDEAVYISQVTPKESVSGYPSSNLWKEMNAGSSGQRRFKFNKSNNNDLTFNFYKGYNLTNFGIYWANDDTVDKDVVRQYKFMISCNNGSLYLNKEGKWAVGEENACIFTSYGQDIPDKSYWSTSFEGDRSITSIRVTFTSVKDGTLNDSGVFKSGGDRNYVCVYGSSASQSDDNFTSTSDGYYKALKEHTDAETQLEQCKKEEQDAKAAFGKMEEYLDDWDIKYTSLDDKSVKVTSGSSIFDNLKMMVGDDQQTRCILDNRSSGGNGFKIKLSAPADRTDKLRSLRILWAGSSDKQNEYNSTAEPRQYTYKIKINYKDGTSSGDSVNDSDRISSGDYYDNNKAVDITNILDTEKEVLSIEISISKVTGAGGSAKGFACLWYVAMGNADFIGNDQFTEQEYQAAKAAYDKAKAARENAQETVDQLAKELAMSAVYTGSITNAGLCGQKANAEDSDDVDSIFGYKSIVKEENNMFNIEGQEAIDQSIFMIKGLQLDPRSGWQDTSSDKSGNRYKVYEEVDPKIAEYYLTKTSENPDGINNIEIDNTGGELKVTWSHAGRDYFADQIVYRIIDKNKKVIFSTFDNPELVTYGMETKNIEIQQAWIGCRMEVFIRTIGQSYAEEDYDAAKYGPEGDTVQRGTSVWLNSSRQLLNPQAAPQVHLELGAYDVKGKASPEKFVAVLDNKDDYSGDKTTTVHVSIVGKEITIDTAQGFSEGFTIDSNTNQVMTSYAQAVDGKYEKSTSVSVQSAVYGSGALKENDYVKTTFDDFYGDRPGNLYNQLRMYKTLEITELYMNSELLADYKFDLGSEETFNCDVTFASGNSHVTGNGVEMTSKLNHLPYDLLEHNNIRVRSYPWRSQSEVCWYGHPVAERVTEKTLIQYIKDRNSEDKKLRDGLRNGEPIFTNNGLQKGYVLRRSTDGTYEIIYSSILANDITYGKQIDLRAYQVDLNAHKVTANSYSRTIQPKPVIKDEAPLQEDGVRYTFTWDEGIGEQDALYEITLKGYTSEGDNTGVLLGTAAVDKNTIGSYQKEERSWTFAFEDKEETWNYPRVGISIVRIGTVDNVSGKTERFPASADKGFEVPLRLSQISKPTLQLHKKGETVEKNSLLYDVIWNTVPKVERADTAFYEVCVQRAEADEGASSIYPSKTELQNALKTARELYGKKPGVKLEEGEERITYTWDEVVDGSPVKKSMVLAWTAEAPFMMEKNLTEIWTFTADDAEADRDNITRVLDLNDYERGEMISVSVRACADEATAKYRDGTDGVAREITLPNRLAVPDTENLTATPEYKPHNDGERDTYVTLQEFIRDGINLVMTDTADNYYRGKYQIAVAVFDEKGPDDITAVQAGDAPAGDETGGYWNSGAAFTPVAKESGKSMEGDFSNGTYLLENIDPVYAGKWLKIALRSVSDSNISSWWSDEDDTTENTRNYKWIRIPRIRVEMPEISEAKASVYYDLDNGDISLEPVTGYIPAVQTELDFSLQSYADGYRIQRVRSIDDSRYDADWIYLEDDGGGGYNIFCSTSVDNGLNIQTGNEQPVCREDETAVFAGNIQPGDLMALPVKEAVVQDVMEEEVYTQMILVWAAAVEGKDPYFRLILPDAETIMEDMDERNLFSSQVSVQSVILGEDPLEERLSEYESSKISSWYRYKPNQIEQATAITDFDMYYDAVDVQSVEINTSELRDTAYEVTESGVKGNGIFQVKILDNNLTDVLDWRNIGAYYEVSDDKNVLELRDTPYAQYAEKYITVRKAVVMESGGGISSWSAWTEPVQLPKLTVRKPDVMKKEASIEDAILQTGDEPGQSIRTQGTQYSWTYENSKDQKTDGYRIEIGAESDLFSLELKKDENDGWYYMGDEGEKIPVSEPLILFQTEGSTQSGERVYTLSVNAVLEIGQTDGGWEFTVTVPSAETSVWMDSELLRFNFFSELKLEPIPMNSNYT